MNSELWHEGRMSETRFADEQRSDDPGSFGCGTAHADGEHFKVTIRKNAAEAYEDDAVIFLPTSDQRTGTPCRLIVSCHGSGTVIDRNFHRGSKHWNDVFLKMGYAVLDVNGGVSDGRHFNAPFVVESYVKAYEYVVGKYDLYREVFMFGGSMGGLPAFTIAHRAAIPVRALAAFCPVVDLYRQAWCDPWYSENGDFSVQRKRMASHFGFDEDFHEWNTARTATHAERRYFLDHIDKTKEYNPILLGTINADAIATPDEGDYSQIAKMTHVPTKIIQPDTDPTVSAIYGKYMIQAIKRGGGIAEHKSYPSGGHTPGPDWGGVCNYKGVECYDCEAEVLKWFDRWA